jgi:hypothetical protein
VQAPHGVTEADLKANFPKIETVRRIAEALRATITASNRSKWRASEPAKWADESFQIAEKADTRYCAKSNGSCARNTGSVKADQAYIDAHAKVVDERLKRAGVRLAKRIEDALQ